MGQVKQCFGGGFLQLAIIAWPHHERLQVPHTSSTRIKQAQSTTIHKPSDPKLLLKPPELILDLLAALYLLLHRVFDNYIDINCKLSGTNLSFHAAG